MKPVDLLLSRLKGVRKSKDGWSARCPAHDDRRASLTVGEGDDGRALVTCWAGCRKEAIVAAVGLTMASLFVPRERPVKASPGFPSYVAAATMLVRIYGKATAWWFYHDAAGKLVGAVLRFDPPGGGKDFRPVSLIGGAWRIEAMPEPRPLYRLPELAAASRAIACEGEKAADAAESLGFTATTSAGGSQAWAKTDWTPLAGKEVWILPDNDNPGRKYANAVATILVGLRPAATVKVIVLPNLPDKGDVADWVETHAATGRIRTWLHDELECHAETTPYYTPPVTLEESIRRLEAVNETLRQENLSLRARLGELATVGT